MDGLEKQLIEQEGPWKSSWIACTISFVVNDIKIKIVEYHFQKQLSILTYWPLRNFDEISGT